ncbi:hypothetical protein ACG3SL_03790 [Sphingomonas sp. CJ20]
MVLSIAAALALFTALPASAQIVGRISMPSGGTLVAPREPDIGRQLRNTRADIRNGRDSGQLTRREARGLRREAARIGALSERYASNGLTDAEATALEGYAEMLRAAVVVKRGAPKR